MPVDVRFIETEAGVGVELVVSGVVTGAEIIEANEEIYGNENFPRQKYQLIDRTDCVEYRVTADEIRLIAEQDKAAVGRNPGIVIAIVSRTNVQYGMSRMYQAYMGDLDIPTRIFPNREEAEEWISSELSGGIRE